MAIFQAVVLQGSVHVRKDKTSNIKIRIYHNRKSDYFTTDLYVRPKNLTNGVAKGENSTFLNSRIRDEISKYELRYFKLGPIVNKMTVKELKERLSSEDLTYIIDFLGFADSYKEYLIKLGKTGTARGLNGVISNLKKFRSKINFNDIDLNFLNEFVLFLKGNGVKNGIDNYMRSFRLLFNAGIEKYNDDDRGIIRIPHYPFKKFKFEKIKRKTAEDRLTVDQLKEFIKYEPTRKREQMAKDMFLLMFYLIGINTTDLFTLGKPDRKGRVNYTRAKTKREYSIKLEPEAKEIIDRYQGKDLLLNMSEWYDNYLDWLKYINIELKLIGKSIQEKLQENNKEAFYPTDMSTNWARHTWATIARNDCRINKDDVALCLGHEDSDNRVTDIYINYDFSIIDESNRKVLDTIIEVKNELPKTTVRKKKTS